MHNFAVCVYLTDLGIHNSNVCVYQIDLCIPNFAPARVCRLSASPVPAETFLRDRSNPMVTYTQMTWVYVTLVFVYTYLRDRAAHEVEPAVIEQERSFRECAWVSQHGRAASV